MVVPSVTTRAIHTRVVDTNPDSTIPSMQCDKRQSSSTNGLNGLYGNAVSCFGRMSSGEMVVYVCAQDMLVKYEYYHSSMR